MSVLGFLASLGSFGGAGFLLEKEIEWQKEEYKRTGSFTCSGALATEDYINRRTEEIERRIAAEGS